MRTITEYINNKLRRQISSPQA